MKKIITLIFCALLIGCELRINSKTSENAGDYDIRIVYLEDGTRCAIYSIRGGVSCDWRYTK